jgi:SAM-dependent methyltransferase
MWPLGILIIVSSVFFVEGLSCGDEFLLRKELRVHLVIVQPLGYVHSLGFVDQARYFRSMLRQLGATVSIAKNRLRGDAVNIVFGAHLGFPDEMLASYSCVFVNLEQLGEGAVTLSDSYLRLLATADVIDSHLGNVAIYRQDPSEVPIIAFSHAAYLYNDTNVIPIPQRPIDLLFVGAVNDRRRVIIDSARAALPNVMEVGHLYGEERDRLIRASKAVLSIPSHTSRFDQAHVSHCLSLGTPVISEVTLDLVVQEAYGDSVYWFQPTELEAFLKNLFRDVDSFNTESLARLSTWRNTTGTGQYYRLLPLLWRAVGRLSQVEWRPTLINLGSGKDYKQGWLNLDVISMSEPDLLLDLGKPVSWPLNTLTRFGVHLCLEEGSVSLMRADNVLEHVPDLLQLMTNVLALLKVGGLFEIDVPYERALTAWQDPTHLRAMNENSWIYYVEWFWYLGWFEHRFALHSFKYLDIHGSPCNKAEAAFMSLTLLKVVTTAEEKTTARVFQANFGGLVTDEAALV